MSDAVTISLIGAMLSFSTAMLGAVLTVVMFKMKSTVRDTKEAVVSLEKHTNSMKDALVKVTGEAEYAKGFKHARENETGPPGPAGRQGNQGNQGNQGEKGERGRQGETG